jgi:hypothetical protein
MPEQTFSRRRFLAATGLSTATVLLGCDLSTLAVSPTPTPDHSPALPGPYQTSRVILGQGGFPALSLNPTQFPDAPKQIPAAVYYPTDTVLPSPTRFNGALPLAAGPYLFPLVLYGHAIRTDFESSAGHPLNQDFTTVGTILSHLASYGCVCLAPDLSWSTGQPQVSDWEREAVVLLQYFQLLATTLNHQLFNNQVKMASVILIGHSHRAGTVVYAGRALPLFQGPKPLAYGLIAPEAAGGVGDDISNVLVLGGTLDTDQAANPEGAYAGSAAPKTWVEIAGANHYGYTDLVSPDNVAVCNCSTGPINLLDENGTISRAGQQQTAAAFLAAMVRYYGLFDGSVRGYLSGERSVEGLNVTVGVQSQGLRQSTPPPVNHP